MIDFSFPGQRMSAALQKDAIWSAIVWLSMKPAKTEREVASRGEAASINKGGSFTFGNTRRQNRNSDSLAAKG